MFLVDGFLKAKSYYHTLLLRRLLHGTTTWQSRKLTLQGMFSVGRGGGVCPRERGVGVWVAWEAWPKKLPRLPTTLNKVVPLPAGKVWMVRAVVRASKMVCPITFPEGK